MMLVHKKKFGQNFLTSTGMQTKIVNAFEAHYDGQRLIEIGPGVGDLTALIYRHNPLLIEIDHNLIEILKGKFAPLTILQGDGLDMLEKKSELFDEDFYFFSNLPYNMGSRMLVELGKNYPQTPFTVILQAEVAFKTVPSKANFTLFGAWINYLWDTKVLFKISRGNFTPVPRVDSAILQGTPKLHNSNDLPKTFAILKSLFAFPSKNLVNNLRNYGWTSEQISDFYTTYNLSVTTRLQWDNYEAILNNILAFEE
jgi:16S rRNA (adenine1518-N6/adenine1519-N6)-dimethyltransferase